MTEYEQFPRRRWEDVALAVAAILAIIVIVGVAS